MGQDKCLLEIHGVPLWRRQLELLKGLRASEMLISCREMGHPFPVKNDFENRLVFDQFSNIGPLGGLASVFHEASTDFVLALAVDLPQMTREPLEFLLESCSAGRGAIFQNGDYFEPLAAVYPVSLVDLAERQIAANQLRLQEFVRLAIDQNLMMAHPLPEKWKHCFQNLNEPSDLADRK